MKKIRFFYKNGTELKKGDVVMVNEKIKGYIESVLIQDSKEATNYACKEGGFVVALDNGDMQVWPETDEDIQLLHRGNE